MMMSLNEYLQLPYRLELVPDMEEGGFTAYYPELPGCVSCGETAEEALANALDAKTEWLKAAISDGVKIAQPSAADLNTDASYSGQFKIRMPKSLHKKLAEQSKMEGISMNQYCIYLLSQNSVVGK